MTNELTAIAYLVASVCFILSLSGLSSPKTARRGNLLGMVGIFIAIATTFASPNMANFGWIIIAIFIGGSIGTIVALKIDMTNLPQLIAAFHSVVGLAAVLVAVAALYSPASFGLGEIGNIAVVSLIEMSLGTIVGALTFTGSLIAFAKLQGLVTGQPIVFPGQRYVNALIALVSLAAGVYFIMTGSFEAFWIMVILALVFGAIGILPIGGADMPVVVSMLNSYSGWAACGIGFTLSNHLLIITGALVGASGAILSHIMCKGMNRSLGEVLLGGFGTTGAAVATQTSNKPVNAGNASDAAYLLSNITSVIIVPGYGMAVARAQHAIKELVELLREKNIRVRFAVHPVAGRMPGHMNVLLAEASISYEDVLELDDINQDFISTDVSLVIGANDVTNPLARTDPTSSIYGMPILNVDKSGRVLFIKRSLGVGYAGVDNELFYRDNTIMLFGDAKTVVEEICKAVA